MRDKRWWSSLPCLPFHHKSGLLQWISSMGMYLDCIIMRGSARGANGAACRWAGKGGEGGKGIVSVSHDDRMKGKGCGSVSRK